MKRLDVCIALLFSLAAFAPTVRAQGTDFLYWHDLFDGGDPIGSATIDLGLHGDISLSVEDFLIKMGRRDWPIVMIRLYFRVEPAREAEVIDALRQHLDRGGRLMINIAELDRMPMMQRFLGLEGAVDLVPPQQLIRQIAVPLHPAVAKGFIRPSGEPPTLADIGDVLLPGSDTRPLLVYDDDESVACVMGRSGQVIVNGWEWADWSGDGVAMASDQIRWLIGCPADLDGNGTLDLFDFLAFQSAFDAGEDRADWFDYDGRLTVFDFLAFLNAFDSGCP